MFGGVRHRRAPLCLAALLLAFAASPPAFAKPKAKAPVAAPANPAVVALLRAEADGDLRKFYAERGYRPLWIAGNKPGPQAQALLGHLSSARIDGLDPADYRLEKLRQSLAIANSGDPAALAAAELALSEALARYVRDMRSPGKVKMTYADDDLKPRRPDTLAVLRAAAFPKDFAGYISSMGWMSEHYVRLRTLAAAAEKRGTSRDNMARLRLNLDRARLLPGPWTHHVVVDASSGQLFYYGGGKRAGMMKVVVGAPATPTPMLAGKLQWAILNPYWNVPDYLAQKSVAPKILAGRSLASLRMEALSDWGPNAQKLDPATIDWPAVAAGDRLLRLRELPGGANSMGKVKYLFPNKLGIYLHDTPERDLLKKADRHFSNGCIRLENAAELGQWLLQRPLNSKSKVPEQAVALPVEVPVYLTYLTAVATERGVAFRPDVYGRDG